MPQSPVVLALDLARWTGCAVDHPARPGEPLLWTLKLPRADDDCYGPVFVALRDRLDEMLQVHKPQVLVFEAPLLAGTGVHMKAATARQLIGFASFAEEVGTRHGLDVREASVQAVRAHFCRGGAGGRAKKDEVMRRCRMLGWTPDNDNEGDAAALWDFQRHQLRVAHLEDRHRVVLERQPAGAVARGRR